MVPFTQQRSPFDTEADAWSGLYDRTAGARSWAIWQSLVASRARHRKALSLSLLNVQAGDVLVDVGCGGGYYGLDITTAVDAVYVGLDIAWPMLKRAQRVFHRDGASGSFVNADAVALPFRSESVKKVIIVGVINYYRRDAARQILREISRILQPRGCAVLSNLRLDPFTWLRSRLPGAVPRPVRLPGPIFPHAERALRRWVDEFGLVVEASESVRKFGIVPFYSLIRVRKAGSRA